MIKLMSGSAPISAATNGRVISLRTAFFLLALRMCSSTSACSFSEVKAAEKVVAHGKTFVGL